MTAKPETAAPSGRPRPRKGVLIRLAIYVPLLTFFGWKAGVRAVDERAAADAAFRTDVGVWLESPPGSVDLTGAIPVQGEATLSAPPVETGTETGTETETGATDTTATDTAGTDDTDTDTAGDTDTIGDTDTVGDTGTTVELTTGDTGEPTPVPLPAKSP